MSVNVKGGHAIMLGVELPKEIEDSVTSWIGEEPRLRAKPKLGPHMTVVFVGRDMPDHAGMVMSALCDELTFPSVVETSGPIKMFGAKRDHVVLLAKMTHALTEIRSTLLTRLEHRGVKVNDVRSQFNPHITVAIGQPGDRFVIDRLRSYELKVSAVQVKIGDNVHEIKR